MAPALQVTLRICAINLKNRRIAMATSTHIQKQFEALHRDAEKVLASINNLSSEISSEIKSAADPGAALDLSALKFDLNSVKKRIEDTGHVIAGRAKDLDSQVHSHPYGYIAGALGVGALAAWMLERRILHSPTHTARS
jgi:ElaB/YqjD/DUF883 family membrane-anchored ribosome-binding protein